MRLTCFWEEEGGAWRDGGGGRTARSACAQQCRHIATSPSPLPPQPHTPHLGKVAQARIAHGLVAAVPAPGREAVELPERHACLLLSERSLALLAAGARDGCSPSCRGVSKPKENLWKVSKGAGRRGMGRSALRCCAQIDFFCTESAGSRRALGLSLEGATVGKSDVLKRRRCGGAGKRSDRARRARRRHPLTRRADCLDRRPIAPRHRSPPPTTHENQCLQRRPGSARAKRVLYSWIAGRRRRGKRDAGEGSRAAAKKSRRNAQPATRTQRTQPRHRRRRPHVSAILMSAMRM